jgi:signal transduction histidine kinase
VLLHLELLRLSMNGASPASAKPPEEHVRVIHLEMGRLARLIDTLLKHGESEIEGPRSFDMVELVREIETFIEPACRERGLGLDVRLPARPVQVVGQRDALKQAILNLVLNGLEATEDGSRGPAPQSGSPKGRLSVTLEATAAGAALEVRDSGPGIPPEILDRIFTMHFTTKESGTGIGLYVARSIIESHGGEIRVDPGLGRGASFTVTLPVSQVATPGEPCPAH